MSDMEDNLSDDGFMSDHSFDYVEVEATNYSSDDGTVTSSLAPPKGWSTLSLSDVEDARTGPSAVKDSAAGGRREFISSPTNATSFPPKAVVINSSTRFVSTGALDCRVCDALLRDCVECPTCHSLFCRDHLRIDKQNASPCPCEPCSPASTRRAPFATTIAARAATCAQRHPAEAFLSNVPVQRMADAVPSGCDGCGVSLSWGELGLHACDQQLVLCKNKELGCRWSGQRHELEAHHISSTCVGRLALTQDETLEARAETARVRAGKEEAERRASSAEMHVSELEARLSLAENNLRQRDDEIAGLKDKMETMTAAAVVTAEENRKKQDELQQQLEQVAASAAAVAQELKRTKQQQQQQQQQQQTLRTLPPPPTIPAPLGFAAMLNRAGFVPPAAEPVRLPPSVPDKKKAADVAATQTAVPTSSSRASGRGSSSTTIKGGRSVAVQISSGSGESTPAGGSGGVMADTASQAPVPAVEACLKPYLDRPSSLLEKKVVVFWPRQGRWYVGRPTVYKEDTKEHRVEYDDGDVRDHVLAHRSWGLLG